MDMLLGATAVLIAFWPKKAPKKQGIAIISVPNGFTNEQAQSQCQAFGMKQASRADFEYADAIGQMPPFCDPAWTARGQDEQAGGQTGGQTGGQVEQVEQVEQIVYTTPEAQCGLSSDSQGVRTARASVGSAACVGDLDGLNRATVPKGAVISGAWIAPNVDDAVVQLGKQFTSSVDASAACKALGMHLASSTDMKVAAALKSQGKTMQTCNPTYVSDFDVPVGAGPCGQVKGVFQVGDAPHADALCRGKPPAFGSESTVANIWQVPTSLTQKDFASVISNANL
jgi:hypothetical protein